MGHFYSDHYIEIKLFIKVALLLNMQTFLLLYPKQCTVPTTYKSNVWTYDRMMCKLQAKTVVYINTHAHTHAYMHAYMDIYVYVWLVLLYTLVSSTQGSQCCPVFINTSYIFAFDSNHPNECKRVTICGFNLHFSNPK